MQDELIKSYMEVLFEGKTEAPSHEVKGAVPTGKAAFGDFLILKEYIGYHLLEWTQRKQDDKQGIFF